MLDLEDLTLRLTTEGRCTVGELADACGLQRRSLQRRLDSIGLSFVELVERARRDLVTGLLRDSARPIADVAVTLGFQSSSTFARWFKANYGATARDYRAKATFIDPAERLRSIVDGLEDLVVSVDPTGQIVYANTRAEETLYRSQSVVGAQMRDLVYPGDADWLRAAMEIKGLLERDTLGEAACRLCVGVGGYEDFRARVRLLSDARGNPAKFLFIFRAAAPRPTGR